MYIHCGTWSFDLGTSFFNFFISLLFSKTEEPESSFYDLAKIRIRSSDENLSAKTGYAREEYPAIEHVQFAVIADGEPPVMWNLYYFD